MEPDLAPRAVGHEAIHGPEGQSRGTRRRSICLSKASTARARRQRSRPLTAAPPLAGLLSAHSLRERALDGSHHCSAVAESERFRPCAFGTQLGHWWRREVVVVGHSWPKVELARNMAHQRHLPCRHFFVLRNHDSYSPLTFPASRVINNLSRRYDCSSDGVSRPSSVDC